MKKRCKKVVEESPIFLIVILSSFLSACGLSDDLSSETDRKAIVVDVQNALTEENCGLAIEKITPLFESRYSNNEIRLLYASAHACNAGVNFYRLLDNLTSATFSTPDAIFRVLVQVFPSKQASDSRLPSARLSLTSLQTVLNPGAVVAVSDQLTVNTYNSGSIRISDRTQDSNFYMAFLSMAVVGTALNRYGYQAATDPATISYAQEIPLTWITKSLVKNDSTGDGCALASGLLNMFDGMEEVVDVVSGNTASALNSIINTLKSVIETAGSTQCTLDAFTPTQCEVALRRLRNPNVCASSDPESSTAAGIISSINAGWL